jgi:predicted dienelactone hydrolase
VGSVGVIRSALLISGMMLMSFGTSAMSGLANSELIGGYRIS